MSSRLGVWPVSQPLIGGRPLYNGQESCPQCVRCSEVSLYKVLKQCLYVTSVSYPYCRHALAAKLQVFPCGRETATVAMSLIKSEENITPSARAALKEWMKKETLYTVLYTSRLHGQRVKALPYSLSMTNQSTLHEVQ